MTFEDLCAEVVRGERYRRQKAFGRDGLMLDGKAVLCSDPAGVVFRVGPDGEAAALAVPGAAAWSPMPGGRGPRGWVLVPGSAAEHWPRLAREAVAFVETIKK